MRISDWSSDVCSSDLGEAIHYSMKGRDGAYDEIMWRYEEPIPACPPIADYVSFYWHEVDHWYEEDEEVFVHARDPFRRIDCLPSSRRVQVFLDGEQVAEIGRASCRERVWAVRVDLGGRCIIKKKSIT